MSQEAEKIEKFATLKEDTDWIITYCQKALKEQLFEKIRFDIALQEQELRDN